MLLPGHITWCEVLFITACNLLSELKNKKQKFNRSQEIVSCLYMQNRWAPLADCSFTFSISKSSDKYFILYSHSFLWSFVPPACLSLNPVVFSLKIAPLPLSTNFSIWTTHKLHTSYSFLSLLLPQPLVFCFFLRRAESKRMRLTCKRW